jgi:hypothetical protein
LEATGRLKQTVRGVWALSVAGADDAELVGEDHRLDAVAEVERLDGRADVASWYSVVDSRATIDGDRVHLRLLGGDPSALGDTITAAIGVGPGASPDPSLGMVTMFAVALVALAAVVEMAAVTLTRRDRAAQLLRAD